MHRYSKWTYDDSLLLCVTTIFLKNQWSGCTFKKSVNLSISDKFLHNTFYKCASYACPGLEALLLLFEELCSDWSDLKIIRLAEKQSTH